jgi:hypothetical protein
MNRHQGFLAVEMMIGLVIMAMVMLGVAAIITSVAQGWNDQDITQSTQLQANQIFARVRNALVGAKFVGYCSPGSLSSSSNPGSIFFWANDNFGGVEAGDPRWGEMALIVQDPTTNSLYLYQPMQPSQMTAAEQTLASTPMTYATMNDSATPAQWESEAASILQQTTLGGPGTQPNSTTALQITGLQVSTAYVTASLASTSQLPIVEFAIGFSQNGTDLTLYSSTTLKGPATQPN